MRMPSNGRGLHPRVSDATFAHWHFDDPDTATTAADTVLNQRPLGTVVGATQPTFGVGRIGKERRFATNHLLGRAASAADMTMIQATAGWTISVWIRPLVLPTSVAAQHMFVALGGRSGVDGGSPDDNFQFSMQCIKTGTTVPYPGTNGEVKLQLFFENGNGTDHTLLVDAIDLRRYVGQYCLLTWRKRDVGAGLFDYECLFNGRLVETFSGEPNSSSGALTNQRWTVGGWVNGAGTGIANGMNGRICSVHVEEGVMSDEEVADMWRRGAGLALPTSQAQRLFVMDQDSVMRDLTDLPGDFVEEVEFKDARDDQCAQIKATLFREIGDFSLAPLRGDSFLNNPTLAASYDSFLDLWRPVRLECARVPLWMDPEANDWINRFEGRIDDMNDGGDRMVFTALDTGVRMAVRYINQEISYPSPAGLNTNGCGATAGGRETVMQEVIDDNGGVGVYGTFSTLDVPVPTQSCLVPMQQPLPRGYLLPTLRTLARHIGWDAKSRWNPNAEEHRMTLFDPGRGRVDADLVISPDDIISVSNGKLDSTNIRNSWTITFPDRLSPGLPSDQGLANPASVTVQDAVSIAKYDLRESESVEDQASQIDTAVEATRMGQAAVDDTGQPKRDTTHELVGIPEMETHDLALFLPDFVRTTVNQEGAVGSVTHTWTKAGCRTATQAEGKPSCGYNFWLSIEAGRNGRPPIRDPGEALTGRGIGTLLPGLLDIVERSIYLGGQKFLEIKNGDFARFTRGDNYPPDSWEMAAGDWGTDIDVQVGDNLSGSRAILIDTVDGELRSQPAPIKGDFDTPYSFEVVWQWPTGGLPGTPKPVELFVEWLDAAGAVVATTFATGNPDGTILRPGITTDVIPQFPAVPSSSGIWFTSRVDGIPPPADGTARFLRVTVRASTGGGTIPTQGILVDGVTAYRTAREDRTFHLTPYAIVGGVTDDWYALRLRSSNPGPYVSGTHDWGHNHFVYDSPDTVVVREDGTSEVVAAAAFLGSGFFVREPGTFLVTAQVLLAWDPTVSPIVLPPAMARIVRNASYASDTNPRNTGGTVEMQATGAQWVLGSTYDPGLTLPSPDALVATVTLNGRIEAVAGDLLHFEFFRAEQDTANVTPVGDPKHTWWNVRISLAE